MGSAYISMLYYTCYSAVYQSSGNRAILLWGCGSRWPVREAFAESKQTAISQKIIMHWMHKLTWLYDSLFDEITIFI